MLSRPAALSLLLLLPACIEARNPSDPPACATEAECTKQYKEALFRFQTCRHGLGYVAPGPGVSTECDAIQAEVVALQKALAKFHAPNGAAGDTDNGFEVPAAPPPSGSAAH